MRNLRVLYSRNSERQFVTAEDKNSEQEQAMTIIIEPSRYLGMNIFPLRSKRTRKKGEKFPPDVYSCPSPPKFPDGFPAAA